MFSQLARSKNFEYAAYQNLNQSREEVVVATFCQTSVSVASEATTQQIINVLLLVGSNLLLILGTLTPLLGVHVGTVFLDGHQLRTRVRNH